jgi:hypothetical protein
MLLITSIITESGVLYSNFLIPVLLTDRWLSLAITNTKVEIYIIRKSENVILKQLITGVPQ